MKTEKATEKTILSFEHVTGVKKHFFPNSFMLKDISFTMKAGYIYGLMGENGAGKTTLMNYIIKDNIRYEGQICIEGTDIREEHTRIRNKTGFVSEENHFLENCTCRQNADILGPFYEKYDRSRFLDVMESMNLSYDKVYGSMSRGERLKFQLAFAIAHDPVLYLLDEVSVGMDPVFRTDFFRILQQIIMEERASVLMTSHISSEIETKTDYVGVMEKGRLALFGESMDIIPVLQNLYKKEDEKTNGSKAADLIR